MKNNFNNLFDRIRGRDQETPQVLVSEPVEIEQAPAPEPVESPYSPEADLSEIKTLLKRLATPKTTETLTETLYEGLETDVKEILSLLRQLITASKHWR